MALTSYLYQYFPVWAVPLSYLYQFLPVWVVPLSTRLDLGRKLFEPIQDDVVQVSPHRLIKGPCFPSEYEALLYVRKHTTIPVPRVYRTYPAPDTWFGSGEGRVFIEMEFVKGVALDKLWGTMSDDAKAAIIADLSNAIAQLRSLPPPQPEIVASAITKQGMTCSRVSMQDITFGPYTSHADFNKMLRGGLLLEVTLEAYGDAVFESHSKQYKTNFAHADLAPRNIIVRNGRIAAIVDWAFAGWYPEYWERTKMGWIMDRSDWDDAVGAILPQYDLQMKAERVLWNGCDDPGGKLHGNSRMLKLLRYMQAMLDEDKKETKGVNKKMSEGEIKGKSEYKSEEKNEGKNNEENKGTNEGKSGVHG